MQKDRELKSDYSIRNANDAVRIIVDNFNDLDKENIFVINCDSKLKPTNISIIAVGNENVAGCNIKQLFKSAILSNSNKMIMLHNHPTSILKPSKADIDMYKKVNQSGELLGIQVVDSIIFNYEKEIYSMAVDKSTKFDEKNFTNSKGMIIKDKSR